MKTFIDWVYGPRSVSGDHCYGWCRGYVQVTWRYRGYVQVTWQGRIACRFPDVAYNMIILITGSTAHNPFHTKLFNIILFCCYFPWSEGTRDLAQPIWTWWLTFEYRYTAIYCIILYLRKLSWGGFWILKQGGRGACYCYIFKQFGPQWRKRGRGGACAWPFGERDLQTQ